MSSHYAQVKFVLFCHFSGLLQHDFDVIYIYIYIYNSILSVCSNSEKPSNKCLFVQYVVLTSRHFEDHQPTVNSCM
jgi:hypothetical protein